MAVVNPPSWLQAGAYNARADRLGVSSMIVEPGASTSTGLVVTQTLTPAMAVIVTQGSAYVKNTFGDLQGYYAVVNDANITLNLNAAHANFKRIDLVIARVYDSQYSGVDNYASIEILPGDPAPSPTPKSLPPNSVILASILVLPLASSVTNGDISTALRQQARLSTNMVDVPAIRSNLATITNPYAGQIGYETDTKALKIYTGTQWVPISPSTAFNVTVGQRPAPAWPGMTVYETDTKRLYTYDGSKWNYTGGGNGEILSTTFASWQPNYTLPYSPGSTSLPPMTLWRSAEGRINLDGAVTNRVTFTGWSQYTSYVMCFLPSQYIPAKDVHGFSVSIAPNIGNQPTVVYVKGADPASGINAPAGAILWQPQDSRSWTVAASYFKIFIPPLSWPSVN